MCKLGIIRKMTDGAFLKRVREEDAYRPIRESLLCKWEIYEDHPLPALKFSEYSMFFDTGNREIYEEQYFIRRRALNTCALLAILYPDEPKYLTRLEDVIYAICTDYTWCLPAHQPNITEYIPDHLDLFATETGYALSEIYTILEERLSPLIKKMIVHMVKTRILDPYTDGRHYWWEKATNNWAAVCMAGVAASVIYLFPERFDELYPRFDATMQGFLSGFGEDGFCLEGIGYWGYGFGFFLTYADLVRDFTDGKVDLMKLPKVASVATFVQKVFLSGKASISFSDGQRRSEAPLAHLHFLRREYGDAIDRIADPEIANLASGCARWCLDLRRIAWLIENEAPAPVSASASYYAPDAQWFIQKTPFYGFAAKGGTNDEPHNHNDIGSFIIAKDGRQVFGDYGSGPYTRQYFRAETRYTIIHNSSLGHSVPFFGDTVQKPGAEYRASDVLSEKNLFSLDIARAYGTEELTSFVRDFRLEESRITLTDKIDAASALPITERFVVFFEPNLTDSGFTVDGMRVSFSSPGILNTKVTHAPFEEHSNGKWSDSWFVDIELSPGTDLFEMVIDL